MHLTLPSGSDRDLPLLAGGGWLAPLPPSQTFSGLHNERVGADSLIIDSLIEEQRNGGYMWGWDRFGNRAIVKQASAAPTVLTTSRPNPGPSRGTRTTNMLDLGNSVVLKGDLSASEDLTIEGRFEGTIMVRGNTLTVGRDAQIEGQILARVATIGGTVHGDVTATEKVEILATGSLDGDIVAPQIAIAEGACFRGNFREEVDVQPGNAEQVLASQSAPAFPRRPETPSTPRPAVKPERLRQLWPALQQNFELVDACQAQLAACDTAIEAHLQTRTVTS